MSGATSDVLAAFAWDFYRQARTDKNFVYSPYSIAIASAMLYAGAAGDTKQQLAGALHFGGDGNSFHQGWNDLSQFLNDRNIEATEKRNAQSLVVTNDFWMAERLEPTPAFLDVLSSHYGAGVYLADFLADPDLVRRAINAKVEQDTRTLIKDLLPEQSIKPETVFVLTNALYFKARWQQEFDPKATQPAPFGKVDGTEVEAEMMAVASAQLGYGKVDGYEALSLPYFGGELELVAIMPSAGQFDEFVATLDSTKLSEVSASTGPEFLNLRFPKFEIETTLPLKSELQKAGMVDAFEEA